MTLLGATYVPAFDKPSAEEIALHIPLRIVKIILGGEAEIERCDFRDRDDIIAAGLARRAWPKETSDGMWKTWMTPLGCEVRDILSKRPR